MWESWPGVETCCVPPSSKGIIPCVDDQVKCRENPLAAKATNLHPFPAADPEGMVLVCL